MRDRETQTPPPAVPTRASFSAIVVGAAEQQHCDLERERVEEFRRGISPRNCREGDRYLLDVVFVFVFVLDRKCSRYDAEGFRLRFIGFLQLILLSLQLLLLSVRTPSASMYLLTARITRLSNILLHGLCGPREIHILLLMYCISSEI